MIPKTRVYIHIEMYLPLSNKILVTGKLLF